MFDIVICLGSNDTDIIKDTINYTKKNIIGYRKIYIISYDDKIEVDGCNIISESIFPFSLKTVSEYIQNKNRCGWYLQQLLKLYAGITIPDILDKYLVIDADTYFLNPITFYENDKCLYNYGDEYNIHYFIHMNIMHPNLRKVDFRSGICHHMMFETKYIKELFNMVEEYNNDLFYKIFLKNVNNNVISGASEYEMYYNYMIDKHPNEIVLRKLKWKNIDILDLNNDYDYLSYHHYMR